MLTATKPLRHEAHSLQSFGVTPPTHGSSLETVEETETESLIDLPNPNTSHAKTPRRRIRNTRRVSWTTKHT